MRKLALLLILLAACTAQIPQAEQSKLIELSEDATYNLEAKPVVHSIFGNDITMLSYNGQLPGPILKVKQGKNITVAFTNNLDIPTTIHWHGIRVENKNDGVPEHTQEEIKAGQTYTYHLTFPDDGIYWYHPHIREDLQQELGMYGAILVEPREPYPPANQEEVIFLDDIKLANGQPEQFFSDAATHALMGRFGNVMLTNGKTDYSLSTITGKTVRLYLINAANTRPFNFSIENAQLKIIGSDSGLYQKEYLADSVILGPSERAIVDVIFSDNGTYRMINKNPYAIYKLGEVIVTGEHSDKQQQLNTHNIDLERYRPYFNATPDYNFTLTMNMGHMMGGGMGMMHGAAEAIEWEDTMAMMNQRVTSATLKWIIRDQQTGKENMDIHYTVPVGSVKKIRIYNDPTSMHPMHHPFHLHGQRFLITAVNGKPTDNYVWKDSALIPLGATVDILVDFSNPGNWMFHCHIPEHMESGMMSMFTVSQNI